MEKNLIFFCKLRKSDICLPWHTGGGREYNPGSKPLILGFLDLSFRRDGISPGLGSTKDEYSPGLGSTKDEYSPGLGSTKDEYSLGLGSTKDEYSPCPL